MKKSLQKWMNSDFRKNTISSSFKFPPPSQLPERAFDMHCGINESLLDEEFASKYIKFTVRDFSGSTRLNIKNANYAAQKAVRDRAINYWQNNVI